VGGILGQKPVNSSTIGTDRINEAPGLRVERTREGSFSRAWQAKGQERKGLSVCQASCVTGTTKGRQKGEYTEGAGARKRLLPLECAVQAAVHLMGFLHWGGGQRQMTSDQEVGTIVQ